MKTFELLILSTAVILIKSKESENSLEESCSETRLPTAINTFSLELYKKLVAKSKTKDVFFSAFSITSALSMLLLGADENTKKEMESVLHVAGMKPDGLHSTFSCLEDYLEDGGILKMANRLYPNTTLKVKEDFSHKIQKYYGVTLEPLNFKNVEKSLGIINNWVAKQTNDQIKEMLKHGDIHALTISVLVNAIYFNGEWKQKFDVANTKKVPFYVDDKKTLVVDMMATMTKYNHHYSPELRTDFVELQYNQNGYPDLSMVLLVPYDNFGLEELEEKLTQENLQQNMEEMSVKNVRLFLPKFRLNSRYDLSKVLEDLGMHDLFSRQNVDLSQLTDDPAIEVSKVIHEASVMVNEEGTEAVAATSVVNVRSGQTTVNCNHPFIFLIRDVVSETIVFMGRVLHPEAVPSTTTKPPVDPAKSRNNPVVLPENGFIMEERVFDPTDTALHMEECKGNCRQKCREECFKVVQEQLKMENRKKAINRFKKNKQNFGTVLMRYKGCKVDCKTPCFKNCRKKTRE